MRVVLDNRYPPERWPGIARYVEVLAQRPAALPVGIEVTVPNEGPPVRSWAEQWRFLTG
ncbi:MAG TPA: hypothetical protein VG078_08610 [Acidimicrobiales bacterium]|nr:hypothetical protein [Acidimicrobiales bacterium]